MIDEINPARWRQAFAARDLGFVTRGMLAVALLGLLVALPFDSGSKVARIVCSAAIPVAALAAWRFGGLAATPARRYAPFLLATGVASLSAAATSIAPGYSLGAWFISFLPHAAIFAALMMWLAEDPTRRTRLVSAFAAVCGLVAVVSLVGFLTGDLAERHYDSAGNAYRRAVGPFDSYGRLALFATLAAPLALAHAIARYSTRPFLAAASGLATVLILVALALTQTRAGWVAAALSVAVVATQSRAALIAGIAAATIATVVAAPFVATRVSASLRDIGDANLFLSERPELWAVGVRAVTDHPFLGIGYGPDIFKTPPAREKYLLFNHKEQTDLHNVYLQQVAESGVLGFVALFSLIAAVIAFSASSKPWQCARRASDLDEQRLWTVAALAAIAGLLLFGLVFNFMKDRIAFYFWIVLALAASAPIRSTAKT